MKTQKKYQTPQVTICQLETSTLMACSNEIGYDPDITTDGTARVTVIFGTMAFGI